MTQLDIEARTRLQQRRAVLLRSGRGGLRCEENAELSEIDAALRRIDEGQYGHCESCGRALGRQRLRASPTARFCVDCSSTNGHSDDAQG